MGNCFPIILSSIFTQLIVFFYFLHHLSDDWGTKKKVPVIADENFPLPKGRGVVQNQGIPYCAMVEELVLRVNCQVCILKRMQKNAQKQFSYM